MSAAVKRQQSSTDIQSDLAESNGNGSAATEKKRSKMNLLSIHDDIVKSASDKRIYHGFQLNNRMKVMVISDPTTEKSAASMDVHIGSMADPEAFPGLAHFCEHMLFMGTEKYPDEDDYGKFISQHAGMCNAYTSGDHTNYYFDIKQDKLRDILDRFSQFFIAPLFDESSNDREVCAVHSEHEKNVMSDAWRADQVDRTNSDPTHDYYKFGTGDKNTLDILPREKGLNVREALLAFHDKYYSANIMSLAVIGAEPVEELKEMVVGMFSSISNKNVTVNHYEKGPYREEDLQLRMEILPVKDVRTLMLKFQVPDYTQQYKVKPDDYVAHLIGHEGKGSLLSSLKKRGWVNSLSAGEDSGARGFNFFEIYCDLTKSGLGEVDGVVEMVFRYINMLRDSKPQQRIFNEIRDIRAMGFAFKDKEKPSSCVLGISEAMHYYPMKDVLSATRLVSHYQPALIEEYLSYLTPQNLRLTVSSKGCKERCDMKEKWYGTEYNARKIDPQLIHKWAQASRHEEHHLPAPNDFIATDFDIRPLPAPTTAQCGSHCGSQQVEPPRENPYLLVKNDMVRLWYKQDDKFNLPKAMMKFEISSPIAYTSPDNCNMLYLFVELFKDSLNEFAYDAEIAGLSYTLLRSLYGLELQLKGYNEKQIVLLEKIMQKLANFQVDPERFAIYKEKYMRSLKNFKADQPHRHSFYYSYALRTSKYWVNDKLRDSLATIDPIRLETFISSFLSRLHVEALMHGNLSRDEARAAVRLVERVLTEEAGSSAQADQERFRHVTMEPRKNYVFKVNHSVRDISACECFYMVGEQNLANNMLPTLLNQIIDDPCFNILRTKEQLGYIVSSAVLRNNSVVGLRIVVQSKKSPDYLDGRIEAFIHSIRELLDNLSEKEFSEHVDSLVTKILEKPKKLQTEVDKYWIEICSQQYQFDRAQQNADYLRTLSKKDVVDFYNSFIHVDGLQRSKLAIYVIGKNLESCGDAPGDISNISKEFLVTPPLPKTDPIEKIDDFKKDREVYPRLEPAIDIDTPYDI